MNRKLYFYVVFFVFVSIATYKALYNGCPPHIMLLMGMNIGAAIILVVRNR